MGCNESKNDVATGNTTRHRPFRKLSNKYTKKSKDQEFIPENDVNIVGTNSSVQQSESDKLVPIADMKDITVNTELKDGDLEEEEVTKDHEPGKLISRESPNHYFSSRKDEDAIEAIIAEEGSMGYYSPHHRPVQDVEAKESELLNDEVQDKGLVVEQEKIAEADKGKLVDLKEPVLIEEAKVVKAVEEKKSVVVPESDSSTPTPAKVEIRIP